MKGIELSRRFYDEIVRRWLSSVAPDLPHAAALIDYGSELLGFDDEISRDHNWGPRVQLFVAEAAFERNADRIVTGFSYAMPATFHGEPIGWRSRPHPPASGPGALGVPEHGLEVHTLEATLERMLGLRSDEPSAVDWLGIPEQRLLAFTSGAVFRDDDGRLTAARERLAYFPADIRLYKIAYAKWFGSAFGQLSCAAELRPLLSAVLSSSDWQDRQEHLAAAYLALARRQLADGFGGTYEPIVGPYFGRSFTTINADAAIAATVERIADPKIRALPMIGSIDQLSDLSPVLEDPSRSLAIVHTLFGQQ